MAILDHQFMIGAETVYNTAVTPTRTYEFNSEGIGDYHHRANPKEGPDGHDTIEGLAEDVRPADGLLDVVLVTPAERDAVVAGGDMAEHRGALRRDAGADQRSVRRRRCTADRGGSRCCALAHARS